MSYTYKGTFSTTIGNELISVADFAIQSVTDDDGSVAVVLLSSITEADEAGIYNVLVSSNTLHEYLNVNVASPTSTTFKEVQVKCEIIVSDLISMMTSGVWESPVRTLTSYGESVLPPDAIPVPHTESDSIYIDKNILSKQNSMPLELFRMALQYHPYHFWQLAGNLSPVGSTCNDVVYEYSFMHADRIGRTEIRDALHTAERMITPYMGYSPYPHYVEEIVEFPTYQRVPSYYRLNTREGKLIAPGVETLDLIYSNATPVFSSEYNTNGLLDTFTITLIPADIYDEEEVCLYINETYHIRKFSNLSDYEIRPINVSVDSVTNVVTITGSIWLLVKPQLYENMENSSIDPSVVTNFVDSVDIYKKSTSSGASYSTAEAIIIWDDNPGYVMSNYCMSNGSITYAYGKLGVRDAETGAFSIGEAVWNTTTEDWDSYNWWQSACRIPDRAIIRYRSGAEETTDYVSMISRLAAAELSRPICACDNANRWLYNWQFDLARIDGANDEAYRITEEDLGNPFGTRRGHVDTWKKIREKRILNGTYI